jgi:Domain of unknown function (DUF1996)
MKRRNVLIGLLLTIGLAACSSDANLPEATLEPQASGQFVASCEITHRLKDDPIVFPGQPGAAHSHDFFGTNNANAFSTLASLRTGISSCPNRPGDTAAYWTPTLYYSGKAITPRRIRVYYRNGGKDPKTVRPFPAGLKMIAGDATASASRKQAIGVASWACTITGTGDEIEVQNVPTCTGDSLRLRIVFPDCWNGKTLDSADHKSHMAYSRSGKCPSGWVPVAQMTMGLRYWYSDGLGHDPSKVSLSSGNAYNGHADFFNSWNQSNLEALVKQCINAARNCADTEGPLPALTSGVMASQPTFTTNTLLDFEQVSSDHSGHH